MTQLINRPVDNGERLPVVCPFFEGLAGVRRVGEGGEFACPSRIIFPRERPGSDGSGKLAVLAAAIGTGKGTVDGQPVLITDLRTSAASASMLVATFQFAEGN